MKGDLCSGFRYWRADQIDLDLAVVCEGLTCWETSCLRACRAEAGRCKQGNSKVGSMERRTRREGDDEIR